jgi:hypothetical protein
MGPASNVGAPHSPWPFWVLCLLLTGGTALSWLDGTGARRGSGTRTSDEAWAEPGLLTYLKQQWAEARRCGRDAYVGLRRGSDPATLAEARRAPRAVVYLTARWSIPARRGEEIFAEAAVPLPGVGYFVAEEDAPASVAWLATLNEPEVAGRAQAGYALGAGSVLWLESGWVVGYQEGIGLSTAEGLASRTRSLWPAAR